MICPWANFVQRYGNSFNAWKKATKSHKNGCFRLKNANRSNSSAKLPILCNKYAVLHKKVHFLCNRMCKLNKKLYFVSEIRRKNMKTILQNQRKERDELLSRPYLTRRGNQDTEMLLSSHLRVSFIMCQ